MSLGTHKMQKFGVLNLTAFAAIGIAVLCAQVEEDEELDPFDMVNFDHTNMRMKKKVLVNDKPEAEQSPTEERQQTEGGSSEDKVSEASTQDGEQTPWQKQTAPKEKRRQESEAPEKQAGKAESVGSCPSLSLFQQLVSRLLRFIGDKASHTDAGVPTELCVRLQLTSYQVKTLEDFKKDPGKDAVFNAHDILNEAVQGVHVLSQDDPSLRHLWVEKYFGISVDNALQVLSFLAVMVVLSLLLPRVRFTWLFTWLLFSGFWVSVAMTWYRLYKSEVAKQRDTLMRDLPAGCSQMPNNDSSFWTVVINYMKSQVTFQQDACIMYYERLNTNPIVMVTPMEALAVAVVQTMLKPLRTIGTEIGEFLRALLKDLPVQWQLVSLVLVLGFVVLILFLFCGYRIRIPFLLSIEPSHSEKTEVKTLKETICQLHEIIRNIDTKKQYLPLLQPCNTVGSLPLNSPCDSTTATGPAFRVGEESSQADSRQQQQQCQSPHKALACRGGKVDSRSVLSAQEKSTNHQVNSGGKRAQEKYTSRKQALQFEDGDSFASSCDATFSKTNQTVPAERKLDPGEAKPGWQCSKVNGSDSVSASLDTGAYVPSPPSFTDFEKDPETLGAVGKSGDAGTVKSVHVDKD